MSLVLETFTIVDEDAVEADQDNRSSEERGFHQLTKNPPVPYFK